MHAVVSLGSARISSSYQLFARLFFHVDLLSFDTQRDGCRFVSKQTAEKKAETPTTVGVEVDDLRRDKHQVGWFLPKPT
jgi:hypothetical protein